MATDPFAKHIVVPVDVTSPSMRAIDTARGIAHRGDEVTLIHVIPLLATSGVLLPRAISVDAIAREIRETARTKMAALVARARMAEGVRVRSIIVDGDPGEEIVHYASRPGTWMVIMETAGKGAAMRMMIGSVADHVARTSPVPVLLVRAPGGRARTTSVTRIVVPLDESKRSQQALPFAAEMARRLDVPVRLVSVMTLEPETYLYGAAFSVADFEEIEAATQRQIRSTLRAADNALSSGGIAVDTEVLSGPVAPSIEAELLPGDLVVMASHGGFGIRRWLLGSVAEHLVRKGSAPVLIVPITDVPDNSAI